MIISSFIFYAWGEPIWIFLLLACVAVCWLGALGVERYRGTILSKMIMASTVGIMIATLCFFKYWGFLIYNINSALGFKLPYSNIGLPIGISFYTFHMISYMVDIYRSDATAQKSFPRLLMYVSNFHQLVAGPIIRYKDVKDQLGSRKLDLNLIYSGINRFVIGLAKKVLIANACGEVSDVFLKGNFNELPVLGAWFGLIMFSLQIYFDFSAYSDMAIGLGKMYGFNYKENFDYPYISSSASEFWRRWHISLGTFFRDYVYIPLGGNRRMQVRNLLVVWFLTGLWHGASWNFILWGMYYFVFLAAEKFVFKGFYDRIPKLVKHAYSLFTILFGWAIFYFTDINRLGWFVKIMFGAAGNALTSVQLGIYFANNITLLVVAIIASMPVSRIIKEWYARMAKQAPVLETVGFMHPVANGVLILMATAQLVGRTYNPFLYFRF